MQVDTKICQKAMFCYFVNSDLQFTVFFVIILRRLGCFVWFRSELTDLPVQFGDTIQAQFFGPLHQFYAMILLKTL